MAAYAARNRKRTAEPIRAPLADPDLERERQDLILLAQSILTNVPGTWPRFQKWMDAIRGLTDEACVTFTPEAALASLAGELRRLWLQTAHKSTDPHTKSPARAQTTTTPLGFEIDYGYERDIQPRLLEQRCFDYAPAPSGWFADHVLFSSAQSALSGLLHFAVGAGLWRSDASPSVTLAGNYFETQTLLELFARDGLVWRSAKGIDVSGATPAPKSRVLIAEPVFFDAGANVFDIATFHRDWADRPEQETALIVLDTTLSGPFFPIDQFLSELGGASAPIVVGLHSGLKLDQAGLELANMGICSIYTHAEAQTHAREIAESLRRIRTITGAGLSFDEIAALEAPWVLDPRYFRQHTAAVFENNSKLADALASRRGLLFEEVLHPKFIRPECAWARAPYCVLRLKEPSPENYKLLEQVIADESVRRGALFDLGGSFGFRGHRYEAVFPERKRGEPFLRIAMGSRGGASADRVIALMRDLASVESMSHLQSRYATFA